MMQMTGCDGVMVGRGARGNPWIFSNIAHVMETGEIPPKPNHEEVREMILRHAALLIEHKGEFIGIREMRKHFAWYTAGYPHSAMLRHEVNMIETFAQLEEMVNIKMASC